MIECHNLFKKFPLSNHAVLHNLSLELHPGTFCTLIGPNGCGKSTLMKIISGEITPDSGRISVAGRVAQVLQDTNIGTVSQMTVLENMALSTHEKPRLLSYYRYRSQIIQRLKEIGIGLEEVIDQPVKNLSGGQRQVVATIMALYSGRKILLLDEHTSALDPGVQLLLNRYTAEKIKEFNLTAIMITHQMPDALQYGDRLIMLHQGRIVLDKNAEQKKIMRPEELIALFHRYDDQILQGTKEPAYV